VGEEIYILQGITNNLGLAVGCRAHLRALSLASSLGDTLLCVVPQRGVIRLFSCSAACHHPARGLVSFLHQLMICWFIATRQWGARHSAAEPRRFPRTTVVQVYAHSLVQWHQGLLQHEPVQHASSCTACFGDVSGGVVPRLLHFAVGCCSPGGFQEISAMSYDMHHCIQTRWGCSWRFKLPCRGAVINEVLRHTSIWGKDSVVCLSMRSVASASIVGNSHVGVMGWKYLEASIAGG
jgi:hypothetical protein